MSIDFPSSPSVGDRYTFNNTEYRWDGQKWSSVIVGTVGIPTDNSQLTNGAGYFSITGGAITGDTTYAGATSNATNLQTKDSVEVLISGISGGFAFKGNTDVTGTAPGSPSSGDFYLNTTAGSAAASWTGISGQSILINQIVLYSGGSSRWFIGAVQDNTVYLMKSGGNMTGDLNLGTNKITLDASTGAASFAGSVSAGPGDVNNTSTGTGVKLFPGGAVYAAQSAGTSPVFYGMLNDGNTETSRINGNGSAKFASDHFELESYGLLRLYRDTDTQYPVFSWGDSYADRIKGQLFPDGSASFAGDVVADTIKIQGTGAQAKLDTEVSDFVISTLNSGGSLSESFRLSGGASPGPGTATFAGGATTISGTGAIGVRNYYNAVTDDAFSCFAGRNYSGTTTSQIFADGSASFAGDVTVGNYQSGTAGKNGFQFRSSGELVQNRNGGDAYTLYNNSATKTVTIQASGSASFAGNVSTDKYYTVDRNVTPGTGALYLGFTQGVQKFKVGTDGSAEFAGTVTANGTVLTLSSGNLDVGDRLEKVDTALQTLKTAAAASTSFSSLKAAIATALANI